MKFLVRLGHNGVFYALLFRQDLWHPFIYMFYTQQGFFRHQQVQLGQKNFLGGPNSTYGSKKCPQKVWDPWPKFGPLSFWVICPRPAVLYWSCTVVNWTQKDKGPNLGQGSQTFWGHFLDPYVEFGPPKKFFLPLHPPYYAWRHM